MDFQLPNTPIAGPASWLGPDMAARPEKWLRQLTTDEIAELEAAAKHFLTLGKDVGEITKEDFPLPRFSRDINALS